jgi:hypothetical protein
MMFISVVLGAPVSEAAAVVLAWDPSPDSQVIGYNIYRSKSLGTFPVSALNSSLVHETTFTDSSVEWNQIYYYVVTAVNASGQESAPTNTVEGASWLPVYASGSEAVEDYSSQTDSSQPEQPAVEPTPGSPPPSAAANVYTLPSRGAAVTTWTQDGMRWFEVNGILYIMGYDSDVPVPGDFDGDWQTDVSIYRPGDGTWWILPSSWAYSAYLAYQFGGDYDMPVPDDYDYDGTTDIAVYNYGSGVWSILTSSSGFTWSYFYYCRLGSRYPSTLRRKQGKKSEFFATSIRLSCSS